MKFTRPIELLDPRHNQNKEDQICNELFGCGVKIERSEFRDMISLQEYRISGLCQNCQDLVFGEG